MGRPLTSLSPTSPSLTLPQLLSQTQGHQPHRKSSKTPGRQISAMTAWSSRPHPHTSKSTECPECRGNPLQSSSRIPSLHLKVLWSPRASSSLPLKDISSMSSAHLTSFSLTASSPRDVTSSPGPSLPAAPRLSPGDGVSVPSRRPARVPAQHWCNTGTATLGRRTREQLYSTNLQSLLSARIDGSIRPFRRAMNTHSPFKSTNVCLE